MTPVIIATIAAAATATASPVCEGASPKTDCGFAGIDQSACEAKGCCWVPAPGTPDPWCFVKSEPDQCFGLQPPDFDSAPFSSAELSRMAKFFTSNLDVSGTGAVMASPGAVPALPDSCPGGYRFHWMRDGALSIKALMETTGVTGVTDDTSKALAQSYVRWVASTTGTSAEPKWNITSGEPYTKSFSWCTPQTDGPPLRAATLMAIAERFGLDTWAQVTADLDWILDGHANESSCDLWEEGTDEPNLLWNRVAMRSALLQGAQAAEARGDRAKQAEYAQAASTLVPDPFADHLLDGEYLTECPAAGASEACRSAGKQLDGAVVLALIHAGPAMTAAVDPASATVARTVAAYNAAFCAAYPINRSGQPGTAGTAGILYGRYAADAYGGGNPWVLLTAALANLLYRAARSAAQATPGAEAASAWRAAFGSSFGTAEGSWAAAFVAAGDSVLRRLRSHVSAADDDHLYEQIDQISGVQYNAKDLTWSYAETFAAMQQRELALAALRTVLPSHERDAGDV